MEVWHCRDRAQVERVVRGDGVDLDIERVQQSRHGRVQMHAPGDVASGAHGRQVDEQFARWGVGTFEAVPFEGDPHQRGLAEVGKTPALGRHPQLVVTHSRRDVAARGYHESGPGHRTPEIDYALADPIAHAGLSPAAGRITLWSVTTAVTSSAGVMSKAGLKPRAPSGAIRTSPMDSTSSCDLSSIVTASPLGVSASTVDSGAATTKGTPPRAAASASGNVPTLLTTSPLAATRSAPTTTASTMPRAMTPGPAPSTTIR